MSDLYSSFKQPRQLKESDIIPKGAEDLPKHFDARIAWPGCVGAVRDQMYCGSCWAFSSTAMLQDRFCIHSQGQVNVTLAP
jgi:C1A family cysteine protease